MMAFLLSVVFRYNLLYNVIVVASPAVMFAPPALCVHFNISNSLYFYLLRVPSPPQMSSPYPSFVVTCSKAFQCMKGDLCLGFVHLDCLY